MRKLRRSRNFLTLNRKSDEELQKETDKANLNQENPFRNQVSSSLSEVDNETPEFIEFGQLSCNKDKSKTKRKNLIFNFVTLPKKNQRKQSMQVFHHNSKLFNIN